jgi:hypothetical protein
MGTRKWILPLTIALVILLVIPAVISAQTTPTPRPTATARVTGTARATTEATAEATATPEGTDEATAEATEALDCPAIVASALAVVQEACEALGTDEICYGYLVLEASPRTGAQDFRFVSPGDIVDVIDVESMRLNAMDVALGVWGVVLMKVQLDPTNPDAEPVTVLLFGDVSLDATNQFVPIEAGEDAVNIRALPSTDAQVLQTLDPGATITANGRLEDGSWLRVRVTNNQDALALGWVSADVVTINGDMEVLPIVSPDDPIDPEDLNFGPMQAFQFTSGGLDAPCAEAPNSGMLIQTPEGQAAVTISIDEIIIDVSGTAFIQAEADGNLSVNQIDGTSEVTANGSTSIAVEGTTVNVGLDENLTPISTPSPPSATDPEVVQALPVEVLPDQVEIPDPIEVTEGQPIPGSWLFTWQVSELTCPDGTAIPFASSGSTVSISVSGTTLVYGGISYAQQGTGVYTGSYVDTQSNLHQVTLNVVSPDRITGEDVIDFASFTCTLNVPFTLTLVSAEGS